MQGKPRPTHPLSEGFSEDRRTVAASSCGHLWHVLSRPLMWHWVIYDSLMTLFVIMVLAVLFNNFV